jgi:hypothetical protein
MSSVFPVQKLEFFNMPAGARQITRAGYPHHYDEALILFSFA